MPKWCQGEQGSAQWLKERLGCLSASRMADALAMTKKGEPLEARKKYQYELIAERMTDRLIDKYVNDAMKHGIATEPYAKAAYEELTGHTVINCGFALHDTIEYCGASPDGLIGVDGLLEIKCPTTITHIEWKLAGVVPEKHKPQMLLQLAVTGRKWCDFMSYDPRLPDPASTLIRRFEPTPEEIAATEESARQFLVEVATLMEQITLKEC